VALIMAIAVALVHQDHEPQYEVQIYGGRR
jgi:hypothetical protein